MHQRLSAFLIALLIGFGAFTPQAFAQKQPAYCSSYKDNKCRAGCYGDGWTPGCHDRCTEMYKKCGYKETAEEQRKASLNEKENHEKHQKQKEEKKKVNKIRVPCLANTCIFPCSDKNKNNPKGYSSCLEGCKKDKKYNECLATGCKELKDPKEHQACMAKP